MSGRIDRRCHPGAGCGVRCTPHGRPGADRRHHEVPVIEVPGHDLGLAAPAPIKQARGSCGAAVGDAAQHARCRWWRACHGQREFGDRRRIGQIPAVAVDGMRMRERERVEMAFSRVEEQPRRGTVVELMHRADLGLEVFEPVGCQIEFVGDRHRPHHRVIAVADVEPRIEIGHGRGTSSDIGPRLDQQGVDAGACQVCGTDQPVVAASYDDDVRIRAWLHLRMLSEAAPW